MRSPIPTLSGFTPSMQSDSLSQRETSSASKLGSVTLCSRRGSARASARVLLRAVTTWVAGNQRVRADSARQWPPSPLNRTALHGAYVAARESSRSSRPIPTRNGSGGRMSVSTRTLCSRSSPTRFQECTAGIRLYVSGRRPPTIDTATSLSTVLRPIRNTSSGSSSRVPQLTTRPIGRGALTGCCGLSNRRPTRTPFPRLVRP